MGLGRERGGKTVGCRGRNMGRKKVAWAGKGWQAGRWQVADAGRQVVQGVGVGEWWVAGEGRNKEWDMGKEGTCLGRQAALGDGQGTGRWGQAQAER